MLMRVHGAAPMLMSSLQFASQIVIANVVLALGVVKRRAPAEVNWSSYFSQGAFQQLPC